MCEGTIAAIGTLLQSVRVECTVLGFEAGSVIQLFHTVVGIRTPFLTQFKWTEISQSLSLSSLILWSVIVVTLFGIMQLAFKRTRKQLERSEI